MSSSREHYHHYYTFGAAVSKKFTEMSTSISCQCTKDADLVSAGKNFCIFVNKPKITFAASNTATYPTPAIEQVEYSLSDDARNLISEDDLLAVLDFNLCVEKGSPEPPSKKIRIHLHSEDSKNEVMCSSLQQLCATLNLEISAGQLEQLPSQYSPFHRSQSDLFIYHKEFYKRKMVTSLVAIGSDNRDDNGDDNRDDRYETMAGVCEMKLSKKGINQLIANMVHFGTYCEGFKKERSG